MPPPQEAEHVPQLPQLPTQFTTGGGGVDEATLIVFDATVWDTLYEDTTCP